MTKDLFHGILLINKEKNCTSHDVVQKIRNLLNQKSVGHAGTLDPMAEGLLVILLGSATKLSSYLLNVDKSYELFMKFGLVTNSYDTEGEVIKDEKVSLKKEIIENVLKQNIGNLDLTVPHFSAVKVNGKKLYAYARSGQSVERPVKVMSFYDLKIHNITEDTAKVFVSCSKGTYIRSWVHYLGEKLEVGACLMALKRVSSGCFSISNSLTLSELQKKLEAQAPENNKDLKNILEESFLFPSESLPQFPFLELTGRDIKLLLQGRIPEYLIKESQNDQIKVNKEGSYQILKIIQGENLVTLLELRPYKRIKILKNFPRLHS